MKYKIIAADDNPINIKLLRRVLVNPEYQILTAASGREALEIAQKELPDLILLDVMMDDMDGYEVCLRLQSSDATRAIPVIFISAKNDAEDKARGLAAGAVDYLTKPFDPQEINARVSSHLSIRKNMIRLQRENQELRGRINAKDMQVTDFLNRIHTDYTLENPSFFCMARVKSIQPPQTLGFVPLVENSDQFAFLILNGFKKDFATLAVELLFEQYAAGYFDAFEGTKNRPFPAQALLEKIMERFSPDHYKVAFSFALGRLDLKERKLDFYGIRQQSPAVMKRGGIGVDIDSRALDFKGKFASLIKAETVALPAGASFCLYRRGIEIISNETYQTICASAFKKYKTVSAPLLDEIFSRLPESEDDQLVAVLHIK